MDKDHLLYTPGLRELSKETKLVLAHVYAVHTPLAAAKDKLRLIVWVEADTMNGRVGSFGLHVKKLAVTPARQLSHVRRP